MTSSNRWFGSELQSDNEPRQRKTSSVILSAPSVARICQKTLGQHIDQRSRLPPCRAGISCHMSMATFPASAFGIVWRCRKQDSCAFCALRLTVAPEGIWSADSCPGPFGLFPKHVSCACVRALLVCVAVLVCHSNLQSYMGDETQLVLFLRCRQHLFSTCGSLHSA